MDWLLNGELQVWRLDGGGAPAACCCYKGCAPNIALSSTALSTPELRPARSVGRVHLASIAMLKFVSCINTDDAFTGGGCDMGNI